MAVAGEPSLGTPHHHPLSNTTERAVVDGSATGAVTTWSGAISCSAYAPAGAKAILADIILEAVATNAADTIHDLSFSDNNTTTPTYKTTHPLVTFRINPAIAGTRYRVTKEITIPLNGSGEFYVYVLSKTNVTSGAIYAILKGYDI
jgi:hypothetical protein